MELSRRAGILSAFIVTAIAGHSLASTLYVDVGNACPGTGTLGDPYCSIQSAIDTAIMNDVIEVSPGTYIEQLDLLGKAITLRSTDGAAMTIIDGGGAGAAVSCSNGETSTTMVQGFTITNGAPGMECNLTSPNVTDCVFLANTSDGLYCSIGSIAVSRCAFLGNGGVGARFDFNSPTLTDCVFSGNASSAINTSGSFSSGTLATIVNCTFSGHTGFSGILHLFEQNAVVRNSIVWGNTNPVVTTSGVAGATFTNSNIQGGVGGVTNINVNPSFADADGADGIFGTLDDDLRLTTGSPSIDKGNDNFVTSPSDLDGNDRISGCAVDQGAFEFQSPLIDCNADLIPDHCQLAGNDCNANMIPDDCETAILDCNANGIPDDCDVQSPGADLNGDGVPDECQVVNVTRGTFHPTIPDAIDAAFNFDQLLAGANRFTEDTSIDYGGKAITLDSRAGIDQSLDGILRLADFSSLRTEPGQTMVLSGDVILGSLDRADLESAAVSFTASSSLTLGAGAGLDVVSPSLQLGGIADIGASAVLASADSVVNGGSLNLLGGTLQANSLVNEGAGGMVGTSGMLFGFGTLQTNLTNDADAVIIANTQIVGDLINNGAFTIQSGILTVTGTLSNNGSIVGDFFGRDGGDNGMTVIGDYVAGPDASLHLMSAQARVGGDFDVAINDHSRFEMDTAELRLIGLDGANQHVELMSTDIGPDPAGLDRSIAGHYPIGTLRIGPSATVVNLVDNHDNDGLGQSQCEAIYVDHLILDTGATLNTGTCRIYYNVAQLDGTVDDPDNVVAISTGDLVGDIDADGDVDVDDARALAAVLVGNPIDVAHVVRSDLNGDGSETGIDIQVIVELLVP